MSWSLYAVPQYLQSIEEVTNEEKDKDEGIELGYELKKEVEKGEEKKDIKYENKNKMNVNNKNNK